jgi:hypothetical protein
MAYRCRGHSADVNEYQSTITKKDQISDFGPFMPSWIDVRIAATRQQNNDDAR